MTKLNIGNKSILIYSILLILTLSLTTNNQTKPQTYSSQNYQQKLDNIQTKFQNQINTLNQQINDINSVIKNTNTSSSVKVTTMSSEMANQRNSLYGVQQSLKLPYPLKICQCRELQPIEKTRLLDKATQISNNLTALQQDVNKCDPGKCPRYNYIQQQIKNMKGYLTHINQILNSDCCHKKYEFKQQLATGIVDLSNTLYKDNLKDKNWFYGSTTQQDYRLKMFQLSTKYNMTTCPPQLPYANYSANKCIKCQQEGAIFNIGTRSCYYCGKLAYVSKENSLCIQCPQKNYYNFTSKQCQTCRGDSFLNNTSQQCQPCPNEQYYDNKTNLCTSCPANNQYNKYTRVCRPCNSTAAQFLNSTTLRCQSCPNGYLFNTITSKCEICPNNGFYNKLSASCIPCTGNLFLNPTTMKCQQCPIDTYYNTTMKKCVKCSAGYRFDNVFQKCVQIIGKNNSSLSNGTTSTTNTTNTNISQACPSDHPYYNKYLKKCQECLHSQIYDYDLGKCVRNNNIGICPQDKPYYDIQKHQCLACTPGTVFNSYSYKCEAIHHRHSAKK